MERPARHTPVWLQLGFRPFFLAASLFAVVSVALWLAMTGFHAPLPRLSALSPVVWHAHEMIYGYALAVVAGFLLTAIRNWTNVATARGGVLLAIALLWACARLMPFIGHPLALPAMTVFDLGYNVALCGAALYPIVRSGQYRQLGIWLMLAGLTLGNALFYLGMHGVLLDGVRIGVYTGLYVTLFLILLVVRRVLPMFIQNGVGYAVTLTHRRGIDSAGVILMATWIVAEVYLRLPGIAALCAGLLFVVHAVRMAGWHTVGIWRRPLLWVLYLAYGWITLGFLMMALSYVAGVDARLAVHAFAYGGIAVMTLGMMARVTLGHTGRDVARPPRALTWSFAALLCGSVVRVVMPLLAPTLYDVWIASAQLLWLVAFIAFARVFAPMLMRKRVDGKPG